jgi:hypothetical protein
MTNKEKYPNVDEAMKAFKEHKEEHGCNCSFEKWLITDEEEVKKNFSEVMLASLLFATLFKDKENAPINGVECPICHSKDGRIKNGIEPGFICDSCGIFLSKDGINPRLSTSDFKEFLSELCKKNKKA